MLLSDAGNSWYAVAIKGQFDRTDPFIRFMAAWITFNACYEELLPNTQERIQIENVAADSTFQTYHKVLLNHHVYAAAISVLQSVGVRNVRTGRRRDIEDITSLDSVLKCTYQVRCNLFHGGKDTDNERDYLLCAAGFVIIGNILSYSNEGTTISEFEELVVYNNTINSQR